MADVFCTNCAEPWDISEPAEEPGGPTPAQLAREGDCLSCNGDPNLAARDGDDAGAQARADATALLGELMGDDIDGLASELQDAEALGVFR